MILLPLTIHNAKCMTACFCSSNLFFIAANFHLCFMLPPSFLSSVGRYNVVSRALKKEVSMHVLLRRTTVSMIALIMAMPLSAEAQTA